MSPRAFKSSIDSHLKQFSGFKQHDAQEFLTAVLDRLHDEVKSNIVIDKYNLSDEFQEYMIKKVSLFNQINSETIPESDKQHFQMQLTQFLQENISKEIYLNGVDKMIKSIEKNHSIISDIFTGMYMSNVVCANCNYNSFTYEPFNILTLEVCDTDMTMFKNLHECINNFLKAESVEYTCERCKIKTLAQKTISIFSMPEKLIIHFKRFKFVNGRSAKINSIIDFPLDNIFFHEVQDIHKKDKLPFELYGIVHHSGGTDGGHYIATTKNLLNHKWYEFNDSSVNEVTNPNTMIDRSAYILFYQKKRITESFDDGPKADSDIDSIQKKFQIAQLIGVTSTSRTIFEPRNAIIHQLEYSGMLRYFKDETIQADLHNIINSADRMKNRLESENDIYQKFVLPITLKYRNMDMVRKFSYDESLGNNFLNTVDNYVKSSIYYKFPKMKYTGNDLKELKRIFEYYRFLISSTRKGMFMSYKEINAKLLKDLKAYYKFN